MKQTNKKAVNAYVNSRLNNNVISFEIPSKEKLENQIINRGSRYRISDEGWYDYLEYMEEFFFNLANDPEGVVPRATRDWVIERGYQFNLIDDEEDLNDEG